MIHSPLCGSIRRKSEEGLDPDMGSLERRRSATERPLQRQRNLHLRKKSMRETIVELE